MMIFFSLLSTQGPAQQYDIFTYIIILLINRYHMQISNIYFSLEVAH